MNRTGPPGNRLDSELVQRGLASSRSKAAALISAGRVVVDGRTSRKASLDVTGRQIVLEPPDDEDYVSRGGHKLVGALRAWPDLAVSGRRCLDAGASTGGFTDVLLRAGARRVFAVDVGHGQLAASLREDPRLEVVDGRNVRSLGPADIGGPADLTVCDLSFISVTLALPALARCTDPAGDLVPLVKPQFEVGRGRLGRGGVVRSPSDRIDAVVAVSVSAAQLGWTTRAAMASPLPGPAGNIEYFLWLRSGPGGLSPDEIVAGLAES